MAGRVLISLSAFLTSFIFLGFPFASAELIRKTEAASNKIVLANIKDFKSERFLLSLDEQVRDQPQKLDVQDTSPNNQD